MTLTISRVSLALVAACAMLTALAPAQASDYPNRIIHIVVPWPPGGPTDAVARMLARDMSDTLHQSIVIDNKAGATGAIGSDFVAKSAPDGYTIVVANTASHVLLKVGKAQLPYDPLKDFVPIIEYGNYPVGVMTSVDLPAKNLREFVALSQKTSGGLLVGTPGTGSVSHIYGLLLQLTTGARLTFVPYRGDAPARLDLLAGNIQAVASTPDFGMIAERKARLIGSTGIKRWPQAPDVATFAESGYPDLVGQIHWGFAAPAGTPPEIVRALNEAANHALQAKEVVKVMVDNAYFPLGGPPEVLWTDFQKQIPQFEDIFAKTGIKLE